MKLSVINGGRGNKAKQNKITGKAGWVLLALPYHLLLVFCVYHRKNNCHMVDMQQKLLKHSYFLEWITAVLQSINDILIANDWIKILVRGRNKRINGTCGGKMHLQGRKDQREEANTLKNKYYWSTNMMQKFTMYMILKKMRTNVLCMLSY